MKRALILSSGAGWGAYHIGALQYLLQDEKIQFNLCAGTGIGAMNAAFVACGEFHALEQFWQKIGWTKLLSINWRHPFSEAPFTGEPQRKFIAEHISAEKLRAEDTTLVLSTLNLKTGEQEYFQYPGSDTPLLDALMAAVAVPGLTQPVRFDNGPLAEGTMVNSFIIDHVVSEYPAEVYYAVAPLPQGQSDDKALYHASHWRDALRRTIQVNLSRDVNEGLLVARRKIHSANAYHRARSRVLKAVDSDQKTSEVVRNQIEQHFSKDAFPLKRDFHSRIIPIISQEVVASPLWSFRKKQVRTLMRSGYADAVMAVKEGKSS